MRRSTLKKITVFAVLFLMSAVLLQFVWQVSANDQTSRRFSSEKVNLALRRTAHRLLVEMGDSTSRIPPVQQTGTNVWLVRLERPFSYDRLPVLLQESFVTHEILDNYDVAVLSCSDGVLELGYSYKDYAQSNDVTCGGRDAVSDCFNLQVTFPDLESPKTGFPVSALLLLAASVLGVIFYRLNKREETGIVAEIPQKTAPESTDWHHFGSSRLHLANQVLFCGEVQHTLTYREAKLLHLFVKQPNQLLERAFILQNVWADEGILVGRSVDVFVSRLRKMLRDDPSVGLVAVHGVGYKLEIYE